MIVHLDCVPAAVEIVHIQRAYEQDLDKDGVLLSRWMPESTVQVDEVIRAALVRSSDAYEARGIRVHPDLGASVTLSTHGDVLEGAFATLFSALPGRLAPGSAVRITSRDRAGGDVELVVEGEWLARGTRAHSDLVELALEGLQEICRARYGRVEISGDADEAGHRRVLFLIPSLKRAAGWHPRDAPD